MWARPIVNFHWVKLQTERNAAISAAAGRVKIFAGDHLHRKNKILPVQNNCDEFSKQYLLHVTKITIHAIPYEPSLSLQETSNCARVNQSFD